LYVDPYKIVADDVLENYFPGISIKLEASRRNKSRFLWLKRDADPKMIQEIQGLKLVGVYAKHDYKRVYPARKKFSHLVGFCDQDLHGKAGAELYNSLYEQPIKLTIDAILQSALYDKIETALHDFNGDGASGMIFEVKTGNVLAMVSLPSPEVPVDFVDHNKRNRNLDPTEVGSVLKLLNIANAIESGRYVPESIVDARGPLKVGDYEITDFFGVNREITLRESLWRSSNIANARVALDLGSEYQVAMLYRLGMLDPVEWMTNFRVHPIRPRLSKTTTATLAYGYGIGLTTLHLAQGILSVITGYRMNPTVLEGVPVNKVRVFGRDTVQQMLNMMQDVATHNKRLKIPGLKLGAKTGTANMLVNGQYVEGMNYVTLAVAFPINDPQLLIIMQMSNPKKSGNEHTTAANVFNKYMRELIISLLPYAISDKAVKPTKVPMRIVSTDKLVSTVNLR
jgi:cell division protein FtsI (penicillin-binding protein 3)